MARRRSADKIYFKDAPKMEHNPPPDGVFYALGDSYDGCDNSSAVYKIFVWCHKELENVFWYTCILKKDEDKNEPLEPPSVIKLVDDMVLYKHCNKRGWRVMKPFEEGESPAWHAEQFRQIRAKFALEQAINNF